MPRTSDGTAYEVLGEDGAPAIVLVHGVGLSRHQWTPHIPELTRHFRVVNYDIYGHGDSDAPPRTASLALYAEQIASVLDAASIRRAAIVGFSIGGMINRRFALDFPDRVTALCILNSPHDRGVDGQAQVEQRAAKVSEHGSLSTFDAALERWFTPGFLAGDSPLPSLVRDWRVQADPEGYAQAYWVLAHGVRELIDPSPPIVAPTLVATCENDTGSTPAMSHTIACEIDGAETVIVEHFKHLGLVEDPVQFTDLIVDYLHRNLNCA